MSAYHMRQGYVHEIVWPRKVQIGGGNSLDRVYLSLVTAMTRMDATLISKLWCRGRLHPHAPNRLVRARYESKTVQLLRPAC